MAGDRENIFESCSFYGPLETAPSIQKPLERKNEPVLRLMGNNGVISKVIFLGSQRQGSPTHLTLLHPCFSVRNTQVITCLGRSDPPTPKQCLLPVWGHGRSGQWKTGRTSPPAQHENILPCKFQHTHSLMLNCDCLLLTKSPKAFSKN